MDIFSRDIKGDHHALHGLLIPTLSSECDLKVNELTLTRDGRRQIYHYFRCDTTLHTDIAERNDLPAYYEKFHRQVMGSLKIKDLMLEYETEDDLLDYYYDVIKRESYCEFKNELLRLRYLTCDQKMKLHVIVNPPSCTKYPQYQRYKKNTSKKQTERRRQGSNSCGNTPKYR